MLIQIRPTDAIVLHSIESFVKERGVQFSNANDNERLIVLKKYKDSFYSQIAELMPRISACILNSKMFETDNRVRGLYEAYSRHVMDPEFTSILIQRLQAINNEEQNAYVGALLVKILNKYIEQKTATTKNVTATTKKEKDAKKDAPVVEEKKVTFEEVAHIRAAIQKLLWPMASLIQQRCANLNDVECLAMAAFLTMNNADTLTEIIASDLPVTADIFDILNDPQNIIYAALRLEKASITKLTANQQNFLDSLKRYVFNKLNTIDVTQCRAVLINAYGTNCNLDTTKYFIQVKDCTTVYSNLLMVAKQLINQ